MEIPKFLIERYQFWKKNTFEDYKDIYQQASKTPQKPIAMIITCCDSRILDSTIFGGSVGDYFIHRSIANIVPSKNDKDQNIQTLSAIEYALKILKVHNLIILGHSNCGGVKHALDKCISSNNSPDLDYVNKWTDLIVGNYKKIPNNIDINEQQIFLEKENIKSSIKNIIKFLTLRKEFEIEKLSIHGLWFDINRGSLLQLDKIDGDFVKIVHE